MWFKPFLFALFLLAIPMLACGQSTPYQFKHINVNDGLSHNEVLALLKDRRGFLWIGTSSGLNRFDGYTIRVFRNDARDTTSLPNNLVSRLFEMPDGRMGIFSRAGLSLYDPVTETFESNLSSFYSQYSIPPGDILNITTDVNKDFWILHASAGLLKYEHASRNTVRFTHVRGNNESFATDSISSFASDHAGNKWVIHRNGILEKFEITGSTHKVVYRDNFLHTFNKGAIFDYRVVADHDGDLWIFVHNDGKGLFFFNVLEKKFMRFHRGADIGRLNTDLVSSIVQDDTGLLWVGTDHGGVNIIDKKTFKVQYILNRSEEPASLGQNSVNTIYRDDEGIMWLGTFKKGISYYHKNLIRFPLYKNYALSNSGLPFGDVNRFAEDEKGNLWIGTNGGGLIYFNRQENTFKQYVHDPHDPNSISSNVIVSLWLDGDKKLWIGTYYGGLNRFDGKKFTRFTHDPDNPASLSDVNVWEVFEDSRGRLWVGTMHGGLDLFDRKTQTFSHYQQTDMNSVASNYIAALAEDRKGNVWIGTAMGVDILSREKGRFFHFESQKNVAGSLSDNAVFDILEDSRGRIWLGTGNGLNLYDEKTNSFRVYTESDGLPHNTILNILEDNVGNLWVSTPNGLSNIRIASANDQLQLSFRNYNEGDGLQGKQFNENAAFKTSKGELIFGGANGFNIFKPEELGLNTRPPQVVLTDFQLFNKSVRPGEDVYGGVVLARAISESDHIELLPGQNVFSIEFAGLNYLHPDKNEYRYILEGFNSGWIPVDSRSRKVTFTNLDPGDYTFRVKAANNDGYWNETGASLRITILPPFWKTRAALVIYIAFVISALLVTRKLIQKREQLKFLHQQERQEAIRMHELDMMKIKFFTNVSHEFRTPLTLILTPLEKLLRHASDPEQKNQFHLIQRNAKRLLNLVNQLLDFRKLEYQEITFNPSEGDVIRFIEETVYSFSDLSEKKNIELSFHSSHKALETFFDQDKLEKILFNLLSNAFKFTPVSGKVSVHVDIEESMEEKWLIMRVKDTGIGIPADKHERIFERFFQNAVPKSLVNQGSGIGLSITREFVRIHGGDIAVESTPGIGSCFTVRIPVKDVGVPAAAIDPVAEQLAQLAEAATSGSHGKKPVLLLVEDNEDFRFYLKDNFKHDYQVVEARNGEEGYQQALAKLPDLIVSDVMMPELNGIELCKRIKGDRRLSHTPVLLLTARTAEEQKLDGFNSGADDYITKPFNFEILQSRIRNLIQQREKLHQSFNKLDVKASSLNITSLDEQFIRNAIKCVETNISDPDFSVENLSHELGISRAHFYKKILSLTGKSPLEFIRTIRLQQAAQLLEKSQLTVAEIAYKVGFNNPKYFARYFKEEYKMLPSVYAAEKQKH
ncbi:MAG TPA: two-component regulator propeller domain-containing protein [Chryseosolibacter sp.]|nr:two-component regulator propeller domain-containing protein [Chryseosolibacter sp.]